jgi:hypothetical protein
MLVAAPRSQLPSALPASTSKNAYPAASPLARRESRRSLKVTISIRKSADGIPDLSQQAARLSTGSPGHRPLPEQGRGATDQSPGNACRADDRC